MDQVVLYVVVTAIDINLYDFFYIVIYFHYVFLLNSVIATLI